MDTTPSFRWPATALSAVALIPLMSAAPSASAAEGGSSHYLPGAIGDFGLALPPKPGWQLANITWVQSGDVDAAVLQDQVNFGLDVDVVLDMLAGFYTFDRQVLGARYTVGAIVPFGRAELSASLEGPQGNRLEADDSRFDLSDAALVPLQLNWTQGNLHLELSESVILPTGGYDTDEVINLGRNYWSFDTVAALTWLNAETGTEVSVAPGVIHSQRRHGLPDRHGIPPRRGGQPVPLAELRRRAAGLLVRPAHRRQRRGDPTGGLRIRILRPRGRFSVDPGLRRWRRLDLRQVDGRPPCQEPLRVDLRPADDRLDPLTTPPRHATPTRPDSARDHAGGEASAGAGSRHARQSWS